MSKVSINQMLEYKKKKKKIANYEAGKKLKIFFICAETSGNNIIEQVLNKLVEKYQLKVIDCEFRGIVYTELAKKHKIQQIFSPEDLAVLGPGDILKALPRIVKRIFQTRKEIIHFQPDFVISVDAYDFCIRAVGGLQKKLKKTRFIHIVAPSVWAYLPSRAKKIAKNYNRLFYLLPFEEKYFKPLENTNFKSTFVGFPAVFQEKNNSIKKQKNLVGITLGSRIGEVSRHIPILKGAVEIMTETKPDLQFVILSTKKTEEKIQNEFKEFSNVLVVSDENRKHSLMQKCQVIIAKSGTNTMEIGALGTAMVIYYSVSFLTALMAFLFAKIKFINLFNLAVDRMIIPELVQFNATMENIAEQTLLMLEDKKIIDEQLENVKLAVSLMKHKSGRQPIEIIAENLAREFMMDKFV